MGNKIKDQLVKLLNDFKDMDNRPSRLVPPVEAIKSIELFSGVKPSGYYINNILSYRDKDRDRGDDMSWFVEIWINKKCIWRVSHAFSHRESVDDVAVEMMLISRLMTEMMFNGLGNAWNTRLEMEKNGDYCG